MCHSLIGGRVVIGWVAGKLLAEGSPCPKCAIAVPDPGTPEPPGTLVRKDRQFPSKRVMSFLACDAHYSRGCSYTMNYAKDVSRKSLKPNKEGYYAMPLTPEARQVRNKRYGIGS